MTTGLRAFTARYSEIGIGVLLTGLGVVVLVDAALMSDDFLQRGPVGPGAFPTIAGGLLLVTGVLLAIDAIRGGHGEQESGEDIDLTGKADWRSVGLIVAAVVVAILLMEPLGWPIAGALLFWATARTLGSRHRVRDPLIALALAAGSFVVFDLLLGVDLPPGLLLGGVL